MVRRSTRQTGAQSNVDLNNLQDPEQIMRQGRRRARQAAQPAAATQAATQNQAQQQQAPPPAQPAGISAAAPAQLAAAVEQTPQDPEAEAAETPAPVEGGAQDSPEHADETVQTPGADEDTVENAAPQEAGDLFSPEAPSEPEQSPGVTTPGAEETAAENDAPRTPTGNNGFDEAYDLSPHGQARHAAEVHRRAAEAAAANAEARQRAEAQLPGNATTESQGPQTAAPTVAPPTLPGLSGIPAATPQAPSSPPPQPYGPLHPHYDRPEEKFKRPGLKRARQQSTKGGEAAKKLKSANNPSTSENPEVATPQQAAFDDAQVPKDPVDLEHDPCGYFRQRLNGYLVKVNMAVRPDVEVGKQFEDWQVANALASVTDAINNTRASQGQDRLFSLITPQVWAKAENYNPTDEDLVLDPRRQVLIPIQRKRVLYATLRGHLSLLFVSHPRGANGPFNLLHYDSSPAWSSLSADEQRKIHDQLLDTHWTGEKPRTKGFTNQATLQRPVRTHTRAERDCAWICGLHVILNGWCAALGLSNTSSGLRDDGDFSSVAVKMVNLATMGRMDSKTILAFLLCYKFVEEGSQVPQDRQFDATTAFDGENGVGDHVRAIADADATRLMTPIQAQPTTGWQNPTLPPAPSHNTGMPGLAYNYGTGYGQPGPSGSTRAPQPPQPQASMPPPVRPSDSSSFGMSAADQALLGQIGRDQQRAEGRSDEQADADYDANFGDEEFDPYVRNEAGNDNTAAIDMALQEDYDDRPDLDLDAQHDPGEFTGPAQIAPRNSAQQSTAAQNAGATHGRMFSPEVAPSNGSQDDASPDDPVLDDPSLDDLFDPNGTLPDFEDDDDNNEPDLPETLPGLQPRSSIPPIPTGTDPDLRSTPAAGPSSSSIPPIPSDSDPDLRSSPPSGRSD